MSRRDTETLAASTWLRLMKVHNLILARARRSLAGRCTLPQFDVLAQVERSPEGLTFRELSRRLLVSAGNLTVIVRRLEADGLVRRVVVAQDRRSYRIVLTPPGRRFIRALIPRHRRDLDRIFGTIPPSVVRALRRRLEETARALERPAPEASMTSASAPRSGAGGARARNAG